MKTVRMINGVTKMDKIRNFDLCKRLSITPIATKIKKNSQIQWFGHVRRRPSHHPISLAYNYKVNKTGPTGRPRKRWHQYINEYLMEKGSSLSEVEASKTFDDRAKWATLTKIFLTDRQPSLTVVW